MNPVQKQKELQHILDTCASALHEVRKRRSEPERQAKRLDRMVMVVLMHVHLAYELGVAHKLQDMIDEELSPFAKSKTNGEG